MCPDKVVLVVPSSVLHMACHRVRSLLTSDVLGLNWTLAMETLPMF